MDYRFVNPCGLLYHERNSFVNNQKYLIILKEGSQINIPDSIETLNLLNTQIRIISDLNIINKFEDKMLLKDINKSNK